MITGEKREREGKTFERKEKKGHERQRQTDRQTEEHTYTHFVCFIFL